MKAFPTTTQSWDVYNDKDLSGMDLRDYFAAKAMQKFECSGQSINEIAKISYKMADAMMEARKTTMGD